MNNFQNSTQPLPTNHGVGFVSKEALPEAEAMGYRYEQVGRYHNYHVTPKAWQWFQGSLAHEPPPEGFVIDGFSPNMNKELHVGHLRNLAIANSLSRLLSDSKFVALLGCSLGVKKAARDGWQQWTNFLGYCPTVYFDVTLPTDTVVARVPTDEEIIALNIQAGEGLNSGWPQVWDGPHGPVIVKRADGRPLYAFYDIVFADEVHPDYYITGEEQRQHFRSLGFEQKHLVMGLVLGTDGKKLKSRTNDALLARDALGLVKERLRDVSGETADRLAWNVLAFNFLQCARPSNVTFQVEKWTQSESPGMYISYAFARLGKVLCEASMLNLYEVLSSGVIQSGPGTIQEKDAELLGIIDYSHYYTQLSQRLLDPCPLANYTHTLARKLSSAYENEKLVDGRFAFFEVMRRGFVCLEQCMRQLGMFCVPSI